jgi:D-alanyl-D-alanine carboxypeptidase
MIMTPKRKRLLIIGLAFLVLLLGSLFLFKGNAGAPIWTFSNDKLATEQSTAPAGFNKAQFSLDDPASPWVVVNKQRALPGTYTPAGLRQPSIRVRASGSSEMLLRNDAAAGVEELVAAAAGQGINLMLVSGYRSYGLQQSVYSGNVNREGQAEADKTSARPGHSEHQTGLAADMGAITRTCELETCFGQTAEGRWLADKAHLYGFVIRYPENKQNIVGYTYEPWHLRYVGKELASEVYKSGLTLEQYFGLPNAPTY